VREAVVAPAACRGRPPATQRTPPADRRHPVSGGATDRLARLLALVPYLMARPGARVEDVAKAFGVDEDRLADDLELLFVCGLPGTCPTTSSRRASRAVSSRSPTPTRSPDRLRLGADEALALLVGLRTLREIPEAIPGCQTPARSTARSSSWSGPAARRPRQRGTERGRGRRGRCDRCRAPGAGGAPAAAPSLLRAGSRRDDRARRRPDAAAHRRGPSLPRGLVPQGRGRPAVPAGPRGVARGARRGRRRAGRGGGPRCRRRPVPPVRDRSAGHPRARAVGALGGGVLRVRERGGAARRAHAGTPAYAGPALGPPSSRCASDRPAGCWSPSSWSQTYARPRSRLSLITTQADRPAPEHSTNSAIRHPITSTVCNCAVARRDSRLEWWTWPQVLGPKVQGIRGPCRTYDQEHRASPHEGTRP
jgi:hypothetical protein